MFIVLFTSGPHLRHNYHGNKTLETMLSGFVEFVGHRLNRPVLLHLCVSCSSYKQRHRYYKRIDIVLHEKLQVNFQELKRIYLINKKKCFVHVIRVRYSTKEDKPAG